MVKPLAIQVGSCPHDAREETLVDFFRQHKQHEAQLALAFCSPLCDLEKVASHLQETFRCPVIGGTTAGEIVPEQGYISGSCALLSIHSSDLVVRQYNLSQLHNFSISEGKDLRQRIQADFGVESLNPLTMFAVLLIDGLSGIEEKVSGVVGWALDPLCVVGGSAGDDLQLVKTLVYSQGRFRNQVATLTVCATSRPFQVFRTHHFKPTEKKLVITKADPERRIVYEINGYPALLEYARLIGCTSEELGNEVFSQHPLLIRVNNEYYVRSLKRISRDGYFHLFCSFEEGDVLTLGAGGDLFQETEQALSRVQHTVGNGICTISFDCVLRRLNMGSRGLQNNMNDLVRRHNIFGFSSYGEHYNGLYVNHTSTGIMLG